MTGSRSSAAGALVQIFTECVDVEDRLGLAVLRRGRLEQDMLRLRTQLSLAIMNLKAAKQQREADRVNLAADCIQSVCRGHIARKYFAILRYYRENKNLAATKIQCHFRGYSTRSKMSAGVEDRLVRERTAMNRAKIAILSVQATCRGFVARRLVFQMNSCAKLLQAVGRGFVCRCVVNRRRRHQCMLQSSGLLGLSFTHEENNQRRTRPHKPGISEMLSPRTLRPQPPAGQAPRVRSSKLRTLDTKRSPRTGASPNVNFVVIDGEQLRKRHHTTQSSQHLLSLPECIQQCFWSLFQRHSASLQLHTLLSILG